MQIEVSAETSRKIEQLREAGGFGSADDAIAFAVGVISENELLSAETDEAELTRLLDEGRRDIAEGRFVEIATAEDGYALVEAMIERRRAARTKPPSG